jgi:hypothetical protein
MISSDFANGSLRSSPRQFGELVALEILDVAFDLENAPMPEVLESPILPVTPRGSARLTIWSRRRVLMSLRLRM